MKDKPAGLTAAAIAKLLVPADTKHCQAAEDYPLAKADKAPLSTVISNGHWMLWNYPHPLDSKYFPYAAVFKAMKICLGDSSPAGGGWFMNREGKRTNLDCGFAQLPAFSQVLPSAGPYVELNSDMPIVDIICNITPIALIPWPGQISNKCHVQRDWEPSTLCFSSNEKADILPADFLKQPADNSCHFIGVSFSYLQALRALDLQLWARADSSEPQLEPILLVKDVDTPTGLLMPFNYGQFKPTYTTHERMVLPW